VDQAANRTGGRAEATIVLGVSGQTHRASGLQGHCRGAESSGGQQEHGQALSSEQKVSQYRQECRLTPQSPNLSRACMWEPKLP
jgi:hypothetical protein